MKTTIMQMPTDFLEIMEPLLPRGLLELAEEARNVKVEIELDYTDEVQLQEARLPRPVLVTAMESSSSVLNVGVTIAPGISTERIPPRFSAGRCSPANQLGLVGPWNKTVPSVLSGSDTHDVGTDSAGPVVPDVSRFSAGCCSPDNQLGLVGPWNKIVPSVLSGSDPHDEGTDSAGPVGSDGPVDQSQPVAEGPVSQYVTRSLVVSDGILSTCDSDQPVADGPVGPSFSLGLPGQRRMSSQCKPDQPVADGPVGQSFTPGPVGP